MKYVQSSCQMRRKISLLCLFVVALICAGTVRATSSRIDRNFYPLIDGGGISYAIAIQPDGKILVGGNISKVNGEEQSGIARLNPDGSVDPTFSPVTVINTGGFTEVVKDIEVQPDGKILIAGAFNMVSGQPRARLARLNSNGSLDTTFLQMCA